MSNHFLNIIILIFLELKIYEFSCIKNENFCDICDYETDICIHCINSAFIPDSSGGCIGKRDCIIGQNFCIQCENQEHICSKCIEGYFPDKNGGCSTTKNCNVSADGICNICEEKFLLVIYNTSFIVCKSIFSEEFLHCKIFDNFGHCRECEEYYYLRYDGICIPNNCVIYKSDQCELCNYGYFLDKSDNYRCKSMYKKDNLIYCAESEDGENCSKCPPSAYMTEDKKCSSTAHCLIRKNSSLDCEKCISGYYLSFDGYFCSITKGCLKGSTETGRCITCLEGHFLDLINGTCSSNQEDNDFKFCLKVSGVCESCVSNYFLSEDSKCSLSKNCSEVKNGVCSKCEESFFLSSITHICTKIQYCAKTGNYNVCLECEENFFYNQSNIKCILENENEEYFKGCKISDSTGAFCQECRNNFYLNITDHKCYINSIKDNYYKCAEINVNNFCNKCIEGYYLDSLDNKCSSTEECQQSENGECIKCNKYFCLNHKNGKCEYSKRIEENNDGVCFNCIETNKEGTQCKICLDDYILSESGLCVDTKNCAELKRGECIKCRQSYYDENKMRFFSYCLNKKYGCIEDIFEGCLKCDSSNIDICTKCCDGYWLDNDYGFCSKCKEGCSTCSNDEDCGSCSEGYYAVKEASFQESYDSECEKCIDGCKICQNNFDCIECYQGYYLTNEKGENGFLLCSSCSPGCIECHDDSFCLTCDEGYEFFSSNDKILCKLIG